MSREDEIAFINQTTLVPAVNDSVVTKIQEYADSVADKLRAARTSPPPVPSKPVTIAIVGAGQRGSGYAYYARINPQWAKVVAVAEPNELRRRKMQKQYKIPDKNVFSDWRVLAKRPKLADAVVIATLDDLHAEPTVAFANLKYNILLEKPMAVTVEDCKKITDAIMRNNVIFAVGHVLRYTPHNRLIKAIIDSGLLGNIINIQHIEPVGYWHFAHSYVRGNWRNEKVSCFSLMTKCCHDIDLMNHWSNSTCVRISSFGNLTHFHKGNKPVEAGDAKKCLDCPVESTCPYSAKKIYLESLERGNRMWPVSVVTDIVDIEHLTEALETGPYGRCVYECDNDVADHQVVNMEFANGATASVTMVAFTAAICTRSTKIFGTLGEIECDGVNAIRYYSFLTKKKELLTPTKILGASDLGGHGGGDFALMQSFVYAVGRQNEEHPSKYIASGPQQTFDSHLCVFAAEHARRTKKVVEIQEFKKMYGVIKYEEDSYNEDSVI